MFVTRHVESRRTETPAAVMTTLASPTQGASEHSLWRVDMQPGQSGPPHVISAEQIWTVLAGSLGVEVGGQELTLGPGDTLVIPGGELRRFGTGPDGGFAAIVAGPADSRAALADGSDKGVPGWIV